MTTAPIPPFNGGSGALPPITSSQTASARDLSAGLAAVGKRSLTIQENASRAPAMARNVRALVSNAFDDGDGGDPAAAVFEDADSAVPAPLPPRVQATHSDNGAPIGAFTPTPRQTSAAPASTRIQERARTPKPWEQLPEIAEGMEVKTTLGALLGRAAPAAPKPAAPAAELEESAPPAAPARKPAGDLARKGVSDMHRLFGR